jgi:hypothetical protein
MTPLEAEALLREASAIDQGAAAHAEAAATGNLDDKGQIIAPPPPADLLAEKAAEWYVVPKTLAWAITAVFPELAPHYSDEKCMELAKAIVPVADKYGWAGVGNSPEIALAMGTAFFCLPAYQAHKARQAEKAEKAKRERQPRATGQQEPLQAINGAEA